MAKITTSKWEAWINIMPPQPKAGTLHVTGEVTTQPTQEAHLAKMIPQGINPKILLLEVITHPSRVPTKQPQKVHYTEILASLKDYTSIEVFYEGKREAEIIKIPIVQ